MRYIDIEQLRRPNGWQERANRALDGLRNEIEEAERTAERDGHDRQDARRRAIGAGFKSRARQGIWRELATALSTLSNEKCWYSESCNPSSDKNVDHFRPKASVDDETEHEGYWWLAFDWRNYRYASQWCNQRRNDANNLTKGGKGDQFPLKPGSYRARHEGDAHDAEEPMLLDPSDPEDWTLLTFRQDGVPIPALAEGSADHDRANVSIEVYHLHCKPMVDGRRLIAGTVQRIVQEMELLRPALSEMQQRQFYRKRLQDLLRLIDRKAEYSAAALAYARGEVYKTEQGNQIKRSWLEEILNSNP